MLIYKILERPEAGVLGGGVRKYYPTIDTTGIIDVDKLVKEIEKFSALSEPDIAGVILALENVIQDKLADGKIVKLSKLGTFYPRIHSTGQELETDVNISNIQRVSVRYRPGKRILDAMNNAGFQKAESSPVSDPIVT